jgi:hypothetical protein
MNRLGPLFVAFSLASTACSDPPHTDAAVDASDANDTIVDATSDAPFATAMHEPLPEIPDRGGARLAAPEVIFVTFADDTRAASLETFGRFLVGSSWLRTVGTEYGVSNGTFVAAVTRTENAPATITDAEIQTLLATGVTDGSIPRPASGSLANALYVIFFSANTMVTSPGPHGTTQRGCFEYYGYHDIVHRAGGLDFAYAVIPGCMPSFPALHSATEQTEYTTSHELIEAATDPDPVRDPAWAYSSPYDPWVAASGGEVADLCVLEPIVFHEGGHVLTPVWSNTVAHLGVADPCVPYEVPATPYINVSATPYDEQFADPGGSVTVTLTGFSSEPVADWTLATNSRGAFTPTMQLDTTTMNNARTATLTITIPPEAPPQSMTIVYVYSRSAQGDYRIWPILVGTN